MSKKQATWTKANDTLGAFSPFYQEGMARLVQKHNAPNNWFALTQVRATEPEPFRVADMQAQTPYTSPASQAKVLAGLAEAGFLNEVADGRYCLNERGRAIVDGFYESAHAGLKDLLPLPAGELEQLAELLGRIVKASDQALEPSSKANLQASRWTDPGDDAPAPVRIDQYVTDLLRFRDDAHLAAWNHLNLSGPAWEAFTFIWRDEDVQTVEAVAERLSFRGFTTEEYAAAVQELVNQGWVAVENDRFQVTEKGTAIREAAEAETDRLFYAGWSALSSAEVDELDKLLGRLNHNLNDMALAQMWPLAHGVSRAITPITRQVVAPVFSEYFGENGGRFFFVTLQALGKSPNAYTADDYVRRFPYTHIERPAQNLKDAAEAGFLNDNGDGGYTVSQKGKAAIQGVHDVFYGYLGELEALPAENLEQLEGLLGKLVQASVEAEKPAGKWAVHISHNSRTHPDAAALARIDQHLDDLNAFRDDCHVAAWKSDHSMEGRTWETFSLVCAGQTNTAASLAERLTNRGHGEEAYAASLAELARMGWIQEGEGVFRATEKGQEVRQTAEETTNLYFYAPWSVLDDNELGQLRNLLIRLKVGLEGMADTPSV